MQGWLPFKGIRFFPSNTSVPTEGWGGLYELRIVFSGVQYRPFGFYGPGRGQFTLLVGSLEKGKVPTSTLKVANERRRIVTADPSRIIAHDPS
jgi:hypothetical protein